MVTQLSPQESRDKLVEKVQKCDAALLISFVESVTEEGKPTLIPAISHHNINLATLMASHDILHRSFKQRVEYVTLDYTRMLRVEASKAKGESDAKDSSDSSDGPHPASSAGPGTDLRGPGLENK